MVRPSKAFKAAISAMLLAPALMGANRCDTDNGVDPTAGTPGEIVQVDETDVWQVEWDNPVLGAFYDMPFGEVEGYAIREGNDWYYSKFDLELQVDDYKGLRRLATWPVADGSYSADRSLTFEGHGLQLEARPYGTPTEGIAHVQALHDPYNAPEAVFTDALGNAEAHIQLHPDVLLVPVNVVVLHGPSHSLESGSSFPSLPAFHIPPQQTELLLDHAWIADKTVNNEPGASPEHVASTWEWRVDHGPSEVVSTSSSQVASGSWPPDRVFDQCMVQFRQVNYIPCAAPADIIWPQQPAGSSSLACPTDDSLGAGGVAAVDNWVRQNCGVDPADPAILLVYLGTRKDPACGGQPVLGGAMADRKIAVVYTYNNGHRAAAVVAHELGHVLAQNHVDNCGNSPNLMCRTTVNMTRDLTSEQCSSVRTAAKNIHDAYWKNWVGP